MERGRSTSDENLLEDSIAIIESVKKIGEFRRTQRKEGTNLVRRLKLFLPFLEEIREVDIPLAGISCFKKLKQAFRSARKLLRFCHDGSKIYLALENESMMGRFHTVYESISTAVEGMPYEELGISQEDKEQMELQCVQLRRAKKRTDTQDMELTMDLMVALSSNDRNAEIASVERLAVKLSLFTAEELQEETQSIQKLFKGRWGISSECQQQALKLVAKLKSFAGFEENQVVAVLDEPKRLNVAPSSFSIPNEFLCPITLEIMTDPVIVATGQTYERRSIQKWLDSNHRTCPKTGQTLEHLLLAPNFALKNLILQWCEKNNYQPSKEAPKNAETTNDEKILSLVKSLSSSKLEEQRDAVEQIRFLSKESSENRSLIANAGGIQRLVQLLSYPDSRIQEHTVTALFNLSIDESNKQLISAEDPIPAIIEILANGTIDAKENSAAALFSLSMLDENKVKIGSLNGIPPLVKLLRVGTVRGKKDAVTALFNLCLNPANSAIAVEASIVPPLLRILEDEKLEMRNETLSMLLVLASSPEGRRELGQLPFIETMVKLLRDGSPKNKECALAVLLELGSNNSNMILAALQYGMYEYVIDVSNNGTERGRRKANTMLRLASKAQEIP
ncbi:U-box domain-containing protein 15-like [Salvia divinorum]|uniref:RING-type E3 ubiquitin transferase n=1 Tax=Salvia divinorum TaxID=28513 RepID=A0ABD1FTK7_SALDI